jgi:DNA-directed RNA polymerase subunit RPC12/RpoP
VTDARTAEPRCETCGNLVDEEDLFCGNCGREAPRREAGPKAVIESGFIGFDCTTCGASLTFDSEAQGLRCAFCGSVTLQRQPDVTGRIKAEHYLPFEVPQERAEAEFRSWITKGFFRPFGIASAARVVSMRPAYVPCWKFSASTHSYYSGDSSATPAFARASWCPVSGERDGAHDCVLVLASGSLRASEEAAIEPFDFERRKPYAREEFKEYVVEDFGVSRRGARPRAQARIAEVERSLAAREIPGKSRNVHVNTLFTNMRSEAVLLPVWINAYRFKDVTYRFIVNGQTGKLTGRAPFSYAKLALVILAVAAAAAAVVAALAWKSQ